MRLEVRVHNSAGNQHLNHMNNVPHLPDTHNYFTRAQLCAYPGTDLSSDTVWAARLCLQGQNCVLGGKKPAHSSVKWQAAGTGLFPSLIQGVSESIKLQPFSTSRSLLQNSIQRAAGPSRGQEEHMLCHVFSKALVLFPHSRPIPSVMLAGLPEERSTPSYLFSTQPHVFWRFDLRWSFICWMSSDSIVCGSSQNKWECRVWLLRIILQKNRISYIFDFLISQLFYSTPHPIPFNQPLPPPIPARF